MNTTNNNQNNTTGCIGASNDLELDERFVTMDQMRQLLQDESFEGLVLDKNSGLYATDYFYTDDRPSLLKTHLVVEQLAEHFMEADWVKLTHYFDPLVITAIKRAYYKPLMWLDEKELQKRANDFVVCGQIAMESELYMRTDTEFTCFLESELPEERIKWFITAQPKGGDEVYPYYPFDAPVDMLVWEYLTTDFDNIDIGSTDEPIYLNTNVFADNLGIIDKLYGAEKVAEIIRQLRDDWQDICVQKAFGMSELSEEQIETFRYFIFEYYERNIQYVEKHREQKKEKVAQTDQPAQPTDNNATKRFKHISLNARIQGLANDIEEKLKEACKGQAPGLVNLLKQSDFAKYLDIDVYDSDLDVSQLYNDLNEHFGLKYQYPNFLKAWNKQLTSGNRPS